MFFKLACLYANSTFEILDNYCLFSGIGALILLVWVGQYKGMLPK